MMCFHNSEKDRKPGRSWSRPWTGSQSHAISTKGTRKTPSYRFWSTMFKKEYSEMVIVKDVELYSLWTSYVAIHRQGTHRVYSNGRIVGLVKYPGSSMFSPADCRCREIDRSDPPLHPTKRCGLMVQPLVIEASHLCMMMRGYKNKFGDHHLSLCRRISQNQKPVPNF